MEIVDFNKVLSKALDIVDVGIKKGYFDENRKEELNNKEQYWIKMFNATDKQIGYNLTEGGQNNFALKGEQHSQAKLTQVQVDEIYELLKNSDLSFPEISKKYHISTSSICMINTGKTW